MPLFIAKPTPKQPYTWKTLGLTFVSQFPAAPGNVPTPHGVQKAYSVVRKGFTLQSAATIGGMPQTITVNDRLLAHRKNKGKSMQDKTYRMEVLRSSYNFAE